jgi:hypothetical protein
MENDEGNAKMEVLDATKKLNLVEENEPVQSMAVEREQEEVINENSCSIIVFCIVDRCLSLCPFSLGQYIFCPSTI